MTMDCGEVRRRLAPTAPLRVRDEEIEAALGHAEHCSVCKALFDQDRRVAELIRAAIPRVPAPQHLRQRLRALLNEGVRPPVE
ncbi:MAG: hypothetical protein PVI01_07300 [Gemmatimonadales bacterium]